VQTDKGRQIQPEHGDTINHFGETTVDFDVFWIFQKHRDGCDVNGNGVWNLFRTSRCNPEA
jgi:hypothetical protein